jgi:hypothetical protein
LLQLAQDHLIEYLMFFIKSRDYHMFPPLVHFATHVVEDVARYRCGAGHMSAYPFENQLAVFGKVSADYNNAYVITYAGYFPTSGRFFLTTIYSSIFLQLMNGSRRPIVQMFRRLCVKLSLYDTSLSEKNFKKVFLPETDERIYELQLEAMRRYGDINLPANFPLTVVSTKASRSLSCSGFFLSTL